MRSTASEDERDSRPLIGAGASSSSSSSLQGGSSSAALPGSSGWRNVQKVYGSELQPPSQQLLQSRSFPIPEEGAGTVADPSFLRLDRGEASSEPDHEASGLPLLRATLSRAELLCLAQSGLSLAAVACAGVFGEFAWPGWLLLAGVALALGVLGRVQLRGLSYEALSALTVTVTVTVTLTLTLTVTLTVTVTVTVSVTVTVTLALALTLTLASGTEADATLPAPLPPPGPPLPTPGPPLPAPGPQLPPPGPPAFAAAARMAIWSARAWG